MNRDSRIYVAGSDSLGGAAIVDRLRRDGFQQVRIDLPDLRLTEADEVKELYVRFAPEFVFVAAGTSGGIDLNRKEPASLMADNLRISTNLIEGAHRAGVRKLVYLASSCCYPRMCPQPMPESELWNGPVEKTSDAYATAKRSGIMLCQAFRRQYGSQFLAVIPATPFGPGEGGSEARAHVVEALVHRVSSAQTHGDPSVSVWGTGNPVREFIYVDDLATACLHLMCDYDGESPVNIGVGKGHTIRELAECIAAVVGYEGELVFDSSKPDGAPEKVLDSSLLFSTGWRPSVSLRGGIERMVSHLKIDLPAEVKTG